MRAVLGPAGGTIIAAGVAVSTFGFLNLVILVTPRVFQAMAADGVFRDRLARVHPVYRAPAGEIAFMGAWSIVLAVSGSYAQLLDYVVFGDWIFFGLTVASLFIFFFQAEDGIRDLTVTGVQTCALPIFGRRSFARPRGTSGLVEPGVEQDVPLGRAKERRPNRRVRLLARSSGKERGGEIGRASCRERV